MTVRSCAAGALRRALMLRVGLAAAAGLFATVATAGQGWYAQFSLSYDRLSDSEGVTRSPGGEGDPGSSCLLGNLLGLGSAIDALGLTDDSGCLLQLLGPGQDPVPGADDARVTTTVRFNDGYGLLGAVGYGTVGGLRPELAFHAVRNDWERVTLSDGSGAPVVLSSSNRYQAYGLLANLWWDIGDSPYLRPYIGGGIGYQWLETSGDLSDRSGGSAYQFGAGLAMPVGDHLQLALDYRYLRQSDPRFTTADGGRFDTEYRRQSVTLGLRHFFGATARGRAAAGDAAARPAEPATALPAVVPLDPEPGSELERFLQDFERDGDSDRSFILRGVNFEFDSDRLLPEAIAILDEAAETLKAFPRVAVQVEGHTCIIGTAAYNQSLSERRANAVRRYLADRGVAMERMTPVGYGQSQPVADNATEEGRRENRRVEFRPMRAPGA